jgi:hypothetical protein
MMRPGDDDKLHGRGKRDERPNGTTSKVNTRQRDFKIEEEECLVEEPSARELPRPPARAAG